MVTKHFSGTAREGIKCQNLKQTLRLKLIGKISRLIIWRLKLESSFIFKDRLSRLLQDSRKEKRSLKGLCHEVIAVLSQFSTELIT